MNLRIKLSFALILLLFYAGASSSAVYKCIGENGSIEYSQLPCSKTSTGKILSGGQSEGDNECEYVGEFALDIAKRMREGYDSEREIARYGGVNAVSSGRLAIINGVYFYQANQNVSEKRVASIVQARCSNGAFGTIGKEDIPDEYYTEDDSMSVGSPLPAEQPVFEPSRSCEYIIHYARDIARGMKQGRDSKQEINRYGGIHHISRTQLAVVNDVYFYQVNDALPVATIAANIGEKCRQGSYGTIEAVDVPEKYYASPAAFPVQPDVVPHGIDTDEPKPAGNLKSSETSSQSLHKAACENARRKIKQIDDRMRAGYSSAQGESLREQKRRAREEERANCY